MNDKLQCNGNLMCQLLSLGDNLSSQWLDPRVVDDFMALKAGYTRAYDLIYRFNLGVSKIFTLGDVAHMAEFCTPAGLERMQKKYQLWREKNITGLNLLSMEMLSVNGLNPDNCECPFEVFTFERWTFSYADGRKVDTSGSIDRYQLECYQGVNRIDFVETFARE